MTAEMVPCVCGSTMTAPYPNDTGRHSTTECPPAETADSCENHPIEAVQPSRFRGPLCSDPACPIYARHRAQSRTYPPHGPHDFTAGT